MHINPDLLFEYGAVRKHYRKHDVIFEEGGLAFYFFQVESGLIKMANVGDERDFTQGLFVHGESFGEPAVLGNFPYPAAAFAMTDTTLIALPRKHFLELLRSNFEIHLALTVGICDRMKQKAKLLRNMNLMEPEKRILSIIDLLMNKFEANAAAHPDYIELPITRQELADLCGLRVETVIRKISQLESEGKIMMKNKKIIQLLKTQQADAP